MKIERFEDIKSWQEARELTKLVYELTNTPVFAKDFGLKDQIRRASVSIMANIAEGFNRRTDKEFMLFLNYALSSASEVKSHLYVALDQGYLSQEVFAKLYEKTSTTSKMINGFIKYLTADRRPPTAD